MAPFADIPDDYGAFEAVMVVRRMVDALGFRFHWATADLREQDWAFQASPETFTLRKVSVHIAQLVARVAAEWNIAIETDIPEGNAELREAILQRLWHVRGQLGTCEAQQLTAGEHPWRILSGPLADALTHVGQIANWRRLAGNPMPRVSLFRGEGRRD